MSKQIASQPPKWMVVYTTYNYPEAHIVAGRLQSEGIQAMVHQAPGANAIGIHIGTLGEITVIVRAEDYAKAMLILEPDEQNMLPDSTGDIIYIKPEEEEDTDFADGQPNTDHG